MLRNTLTRFELYLAFFGSTNIGSAADHRRSTARLDLFRFALAKRFASTVARCFCLTAEIATGETHPDAPGPVAS